MDFHKYISIIFAAVLILGCSGWDLERVGFTQVITIGVIDISSNGAFLLGDIENLRGSTLDEAGFLVSRDLFDETEFRINNPDITKFRSAEQQSITENQAFAVAVGDLDSGTPYYFRAYGIVSGEDNPAYGVIDSFTTTGFNIFIQEFSRQGSGCPTEARIQLKLDIRGVLPSSVEFGIVWQHDLFSDPTVDGNVILASQVDGDGNTAVLMPVLCGELYRVRSFIRPSENEVLYGQAIEFTAQTGGVWEYVGEIPEQFARSQGIRSFSLDQKGYIIGLQKEGAFQNAFWQFNSKSLNWSSFAVVPGGFVRILWIPSSSDKILAAGPAGLLEYIPAPDEWVLLGDLPPAINRKTGFEFENKIYFLEGSDIGFVRLSDPSTFVSLAPFPSEVPPDISFRIGSSGYMALGGFSQIPFIDSQELWQFNLPTNSWQLKAAFPEKVFTQIGFSMNGRGYVLGGIDVDLKPHPGFWEYDPDNDTWTRLADFGRGDGNADIGFAIDGSAYGGLGASFEGVDRQEFWKYVQELK